MYMYIVIATYANFVTHNRNNRCFCLQPFNFNYAIPPKNELSVSVCGNAPSRHIIYFISIDKIKCMFFLNFCFFSYLILLEKRNCCSYQCTKQESFGMLPLYEWTNNVSGIDFRATEKHFHISPLAMLMVFFSYSFTAEYL